MKISYLFIAIFFLISQTSHAESSNGKDLFNQYCSSCHGISGGMEMSNRIAPPIIAVKQHYISSYQDEDSFVDAIVNWVNERNPEDSMMRGAINRFNIMPEVKVPQNMLKDIATYIYKGDIDLPVGFQEHFQKRHGKNKQH